MTWFLDLETRSRADLSKVGGRNYAEDPSTEVLCAVAVSLEGDTAAVHAWVPYEAELYPLVVRYPGEAAPWSSAEVHVYQQADVPAPFLDAARDHTPVWAHNCNGFDALVWRAQGWPDLNWVDSLPYARRRGLPGGLDRIGKELYGQGKTAGKTAMMRLCKPQKGGQFVEPTNETLSATLQYCLDDVLLTLALWHDELRDEVNHPDNPVLALDQRINARGVGFDSDLARVLLLVEQNLRRREVRHIEQATEGDVDKKILGSPAKLLRWLKKQYRITLPTTDASLLTALLKHPHVPKQAKMVLWGRLGKARIAAGKLTRAIDQRGPDGRLRDSLAYYAAFTGRWGGRGFQPQNLPRPCDLPEGTADRVANGEVAAIGEAARANGLTVDDVLSTLVRACLVPAPGKMLGAVDFSAIEARVLCWLADDQPGLDVFREGLDPYKHFATHLYGVEYADVTKKQRAASKPPVLGCLAQGTEVLTRKGWRAIETVLPGELVWDGRNWVATDGAIPQGEKPCINFRGVWLTPDHEILLGDNTWLEAQRASGRNLKSANVSAAGPSYPSKEAPGEVYRQLSHSKTAVEVHTKNTYDLLNAGPRHQFVVRGEGRPFIVHNCGYQLGPDRLEAYAAGMGINMQAAGVSPREAIEIWRDLHLPIAGQVTGKVWEGHILRKGGLWRDLGKGVFRIVQEVDSVGATIGKCHWRMEGKHLLSRLPSGRDLIYRNARIEMVETRFESQEKKAQVTYDHVQGGASSRRSTFGGRFCISEGTPVLTKRGWVAIENVTDEDKVWDGVEWVTCGGAECRGRRPVIEVCGVSMTPDHLVLTEEYSWQPARNLVGSRSWSSPANLTGAGRLLGNPQKKSGERMTVTYDVVDAGPRKRFIVRGDKPLVVHNCENITQAAARDLLAEAMLRIDAAGFPIVLSVHDEVICELDEDAAQEQLDRMTALMVELPAWVEGLPIGAAGFACRRYGKEAGPGDPTSVA